jgi:hypothetical protein
VLLEDVDQPAVRAARLRVKHGPAVGVGAKCPWRQHPELRVPQALAAQRLGAAARLGAHDERQPGEADRDGDRERVHGQVQPLRPDAAGAHGRHLALVIEPAEGEHRRKQHADRHEHHQVLERREADQREHDVVREAPLRRDAENARRAGS